jgi:hypothetical protein
MANEKVRNHPLPFRSHIILDLLNQSLTGFDVSPNATNVGFDNTECRFHSHLLCELKYGMMEYWNVGMMASEGKGKSFSPFFPNTPLFQSSIIPEFRP